MKTETKTVYKCDFCNKLYQIKSACESHEKRCYKNPRNYRPCLHCNHLIKKDCTIWQDGYYGDFERDMKLLYCEEKNLFLYPPSVEHKHNVIDLGDFSNERMPIECKVYEGYLK